VRFSRKVAKSVKRWPIFFDFTKGGQVSKKVANVVRFLRKVAKSVEWWPMLFDFTKGGQVSSRKGGQCCAIFAKGGQVSKKVANVVRFRKRWPSL